MVIGRESTGGRVNAKTRVKYDRMILLLHRDVPLMLSIKNVVGWIPDGRKWIIWCFRCISWYWTDRLPSPHPLGRGLFRDDGAASMMRSMVWKTRVWRQWLSRWGVVCRHRDRGSVCTTSTATHAATLRLSKCCFSMFSL